MKLDKKKGIERQQINFSILESSIISAMEVWFIDFFVVKLNLQILGVKSHTQEKQAIGRINLQAPF